MAAKIHITGHNLTSQKNEIFKERTKTKKDVVVTLVTTHGLRRGLFNDEVIESVVTADALMR